MSVMSNSLAYALADKVGALWSSETVQQQTMGMEACEFRDYIAGQLGEVLGQYGAKRPANRPGKPATPSVAAPATDYSSITHTAALQLLENAPPGIRDVYRQERQAGNTPADALATAMEAFRRLQEAEAESQGSAAE